MPVSVVVGGQYGSEGKGKVALYLSKEEGATAAIRVGGPNSGHTAIDDLGRRFVLRQLPTAALTDRVVCVIGPGSYIDPGLLSAEISTTRINDDRLVIDPSAVIIEDCDRTLEAENALSDRIGSTLSGTGGAVQRRASRAGKIRTIVEEPSLRRFVQPSVPYVRRLLAAGARIIVEGTQGFGLSLFHTDEYPYATSRDTTASSAMSEAGLSPLDVDRVVLVIRAYPIRVAGNSGALKNELSWKQLTASSGSRVSLEERTSVTGRVRRVGAFDPVVVRRAIEANDPTSIVLNHLDYIDAESSRLKRPTPKILEFVKSIEEAIGRTVDLYGLSPSLLVPESIQCKLTAAHG